jgi:multiple sugar transport system permease protein
MARAHGHRRRPVSAKRILFVGVGLALSALFIAPIFWTMLSSFKPAAEARLPPLPPWPSRFTLENYGALNSFGSGIRTHLGNSLVVALGTIVLTTLVSALAGYGFSRFEFRGKDVLFVLIILKLMIPFQSVVTPLFLVLSYVRLQNSLIGLTLVYATLQLPFSVFMMRNAFDTVPREIEEAARIDGCSTFAMLTRVMLPLVVPGLVTVCIFAFLGSWNEFLGALILLTNNDLYTLPILVTAVRSGLYGTIDWGAVQAGVTVMMIPCLLIFLLLQRYYMRGLTSGAIK